MSEELLQRGLIKNPEKIAIGIFIILVLQA